jgi:DNA-binding response OmpR family regulator
MSDTNNSRPSSAPNIYFIDDSATMREVVKIAFRRENFNVVTCSDVTSAINLFAQTIPDAIISDVIMPDKDGYELCQFVKQHPELRDKPVILMSGIVNQQVAEKAHEVKADELLRKPFHPQDLVARVKKLLNREISTEKPAPSAAAPVNPLSQLFGFPVLAPAATSPSAPPRRAQTTSVSPSASATSAPAAPHVATSTASSGVNGNSAEINKLRSEIQHLGSLVKKLQAQLEVEREYCAALESQLRTLSTAD